MPLTITDDQFIEIWSRYRGAAEVSRRVGLTERGVHSRRRSIERRTGIELVAEKGPVPSVFRHHELNNHHAVYDLAIDDGVVLVGSDCHYWPGIITTAHTVFVQMCKELQPKAIIMNGDVLDGARISRHPPIGWEQRPQLIQELETCQQRLSEIEDACKNAKKIWTLGNHDGRFETKLAANAPEYARVHGVHLKDHFPMWLPAWATWINDDTVVKHRYKGGIHATHNNTVASGKSMVTGHLHSLKVTPYSDYNGTRYGVDTGTMAPIYGPQTSDYTEVNPVNWRQGFVVLTYHKGRLLWPEVVHVCGPDEFEFRGKLYHVEPAE